MIISGNYVVLSLVRDRDNGDTRVFEMACPAGGCEGGGVELQTLREACARALAGFPVSAGSAAESLWISVRTGSGHPIG